MEKDFKKLKLDLLAYRHIHLIYATIIALMIGILARAVINEHSNWYIALQFAIILSLVYILIFRLKNERTEIKVRSDIFL